jgi:cobaltochelatase CobN
MQLSHPYSVDLYAGNSPGQSQLVVVRMLGGGSYWRYGLDEAVRLARANQTKLVVLSGDATWDAALAEESTVGQRWPENSGPTWSKVARRTWPMRYASVRT